MKSSTRSGLAAAAGLVLLVATVGWLSGACERRVEPGRVDVAVEEVSGGAGVAPVEERVEPALEWTSGQVASARHTAVSSRVLAQIEEVRVSAGSPVSEGQVLVVLDARDLAAQVGAAGEALRAARARLAVARSEHERAQSLLREGAGTQQRLDQAVGELRAAEAEAQGLAESLDQAQTARSYAEIRSPVGGRVVDRLAEPGDTAVPGRPLLRIYDPTLLRVEAPVRESLAVALRVGQSLPVEIPALGEVVEGEIDEIVPFAEPGARTLLVKVLLPKTDERLFAGLYARVAVPAGTRRRVLVPAGAVEQVGQLAFVAVVGEDGAVVRRMVTLGPPGEDGVIEILSGLEKGERVRVPDVPPAPARAAAAISAFQQELVAALTTALAQGPETAITVCSEQAPAIAERIAASGVAVGRTSHKLRNPANAPAPWMRPLLAAFLEDPPPPGASRTLDLGAQGTGIVQPIYTQPLCLTCHGPDVDPALLSRIRERYPDDDAVGFAVGDLRGLVWAVVPPGGAGLASE